MSQSFLSKLSFAESYLFLKYIDELVVLYCFPFGIRVAIIEYKKNHLFKTFILVYLSYVFWTLISSVFGNVTLIQYFYQLVLDSKFIIVFLYLYGSYREFFSKFYFDKAIRFLVLVNVILVGFQFILPDLYDSTFSLGAHHGVFVTTSGLHLNRMAGVFWFTGLLALFSSIAVGYFFIDIKDFGKNKRNRIYLVLSILLLLSTLSRGEISACFLASVLIYVNFYTKKGIGVMVLSITSVFIAVIGAQNLQFVDNILIELGVYGTQLDVAPRAKLLLSSIEEANANFPLGAGLGSLGGESAKLFDSELFYKYGFHYEWYFDKGLFLTDTYWPKIIAESGWIGAVMLLVFYMYYPFNLVVKNGGGNFERVFVIYSFTVLILISLSSPIFNDTLSLFLSLYFVGGVFNKLESR